VAAFTAIVAILTGNFDKTDWRVIATSLGFTVFSALAASGAALRLRDSEGLRMLGLATMAFSAGAFLLLLVALWSEGDPDLWRWFGSVALVALACSHASLVSRARRSSDSPAVQSLAGVSMALGAWDAFLGVLAVSGAIDQLGHGFGQLMAVLVILLLLATGLTPILRRLQRSEAPASSPPAPSASEPLALEVLAAADRIDALNRHPGSRAPEIRRECERLRELARSHHS
jgi:hypothetical protein